MMVITNPHIHRLLVCLPFDLSIVYAHINGMYKRHNEIAKRRRYLNIFFWCMLYHLLCSPWSFLFAWLISIIKTTVDIQRPLMTYASTTQSPKTEFKPIYVEDCVTKEFTPSSAWIMVVPLTVWGSAEMKFATAANETKRYGRIRYQPLLSGCCKKMFNVRCYWEDIIQSSPQDLTSTIT